MTRLGQSGLETGDTLAVGSDGVGSNGGAVAVVTTLPAPRTGTYCLKCTVGNPNTASTWASWLGKKTITHASKSEVWYAFGVRVVHTTEPAQGGSALLFVAYDVAGNANVLVTIDAGTLRAYYATAGGGTPTFAQCTLIGAASASMSSDAWHLIEIRIVAATGNTGNFELYLDGVSVISTSSQRTAQSNANLGSFAVLFGALQSISNIGSASYHAFDDIRWQDTLGSVNNGRPGDEVVRLLVPSAAGDLTQFTRGGTDSGANWSQVEEVPPNGADYVQATNVGDTDLYNTADTVVASVSAVSLVGYVGNPTGSGGSINLITKTAAGQSDGPAYTLSPGWTYQSRLLETDPADAAAWNQAKLNALQIGCKVAS